MPPPPTSHTVSSCVRAMSACADASCQYTLTTVPLSHTRSRANAWSSLVRSAPSPSLCLLSTLTAHPLADRGCDAPPLASHTASSWVRAILVFCASCALSSGNISSPDARTHSCVRTSHVCTRVPTRVSRSMPCCLCYNRCTVVATHHRWVVLVLSALRAPLAHSYAPCWPLKRVPHPKYMYRHSMRARLCARPT